MSEPAQELAAGTLFVVSTPIGNLQDITLRALDVLSKVDSIAAEDTRRTRILLDHFNIATPITSYHDHNKERKTAVLIEKLKAGERIALVSDAGTPGISDPAFRLVQGCVGSELPIIIVPGATAFVPALILSSLPTDRFVFEGFLPRKKGRKKRIDSIKSDPRTLIFYESPYRVQTTITDLFKALGNRRAALVRELTKKFEEIHRGRLGDLKEKAGQMTLKGEFVLVVEGKRKEN